MMKRIVVLVPPEDRAERALHLAARLAGISGAELVAVRALEEQLRPGAEGSAPEAIARLRTLMLEAEQDALEALVEPHREAGLEIRTCVRWGVPHEVVLDLIAAEDEVDLVVKPARGLSHDGRVFFGMTALHLFRKCPCPVWVVGDEGRLPERILAAVDPGDDPLRSEMGRRVVERAARAAALCNAALHVVACWHAPAAQMLEGRVDDAELKAYVHDRHRRARAGLDAILEISQTVTPPSRVELVEGDAREELAKLAEQEDVDLVVIGTLGRSGEVSEVMGETAEMLVRSVRSSILTVSPVEIGAN